MDEKNMDSLVNVLGGIGDHLIFQMAFSYHLKNDLSYMQALEYTLDKLSQTQDYIPEWVASRNKQKSSV